MENNIFIIFNYVLHMYILMSHNMIKPYFYIIFKSQIVLYLLQSTLVFSFYIDVVLTFSITVFWMKSYDNINVWVYLIEISTSIHCI